MREVDVMVVGAGQAGLAMGYYLKAADRSFMIVGREKRIGDVWRSRYDSLVLFTPRWYSSLPGMPLAGDPNGYATKDEIADYLEQYATVFELPVKLNTGVVSVERQDDRFVAETTDGCYRAKQVVIAAGPFTKPYVPSMAANLSGEVYQLHTTSYFNPKQLRPGSVLVVGAGNSGAQIAAELSQERKVTLSAGHSLKFFPLRLAGRSIFWWFNKLGILDADVNGLIGTFLRKQADPIFGTELRDAMKQGAVAMKPRATGARDTSVTFADSSTLEVDNVIWATGFRPDYGWLRIPGALNAEGKPVHTRGASPVEGLYFLGLPWQTRRGSALIGGVGRDAAYLADKIRSTGRQSH